MKTKTKLTAVDREFFAMVARAAFANPFSQARLELDRQIAGAPDTASWDEGSRWSARSESGWPG